MSGLLDIAQQLASGRTSSRALTEASLARIADPAGEGPRTFVRVFGEAALASADAIDRLRAAGIPLSPLAGIPISVKDLCDIAGSVTLAGSLVRTGEAPAKHDAVAVARLRAAGAIIVGTTNMTEFAMGGLGLNPHYGNCRNPWDRQTGRVPGGSSSGAAVSVTDGMVPAALGSDTAGSIRLPAALCGLVGFKPTAARASVEGLFPLSTTLDSVGPLASSVSCCALFDAVLAGETPRPPIPVPLAGLRFGLPSTVVTDNLDDAVAGAFERVASQLSKAGVRIETFPFHDLARLTELNRTRALSVVESYAIHRADLHDREARYDPRVSTRMLAGARIGAADYYEMLQFRREAIARARELTHGYDAIIMPTVPVTAPPISNFVGSEERLRDAFPLVIRNTNIANFLDRCAITLPCHEYGTAPVGFSLMGEHMGDPRLLGIAASVEAFVAEQLHRS